MFGFFPFFGRRRGFGFGRSNKRPPKDPDASWILDDYKDSTKIPKTTAKQVYKLTDKELELLACKRQSHPVFNSSMYLYSRIKVVALACKKYGCTRKNIAEVLSQDRPPIVQQLVERKNAAKKTPAKKTPAKKSTAVRKTAAMVPLAAFGPLTPSSPSSSSSASSPSNSDVEMAVTSTPNKKTAPSTVTSDVIVLDD